MPIYSNKVYAKCKFSEWGQSTYINKLILSLLALLLINGEATLSFAVVAEIQYTKRSSKCHQDMLGIK